MSAGCPNIPLQTISKANNDGGDVYAAMCDTTARKSLKNPLEIAQESKRPRGQATAKSVTLGDKGKRKNVVNPKHDKTGMVREHTPLKKVLPLGDSEKRIFIVSLKFRSK